MTGSRRPSLEGMLEHLYASVLDPARFDDFAGELRLAMNAHLVALQTDDAGHRHHVQTHFTDAPLDVPTPDYANDASINAFFAKGSRVFQQQGVIDGNSLFDRGELERTAFYQEVLSAVDVQHSMGLCVKAGPSGHLIALTVSRDRHRPAFEPEALQLAQRLLPHLRNVFALSQKFQQLESTASIMDRVTYGIWLLGADGHVVRANSAGQVLLADRGGGLQQRNSALKAAWPADKVTLEMAIKYGTSPCGSRRSDLLLHDTAGQPWAVCNVHPLSRNTLDALVPTTPAACIVLVHPFTTTTPAGEATLRAVFGLTPAEAELAEALLRHCSLSACSTSSGKSHETLRTQLKALFVKTETHRQADLIRRLQAALG